MLLGNELVLTFFCSAFPGAIKTNAVFDIETKPFYWLTVCAQDHGIVPLYSCAEVRVAVKATIGGV